MNRPNRRATLQLSIFMSFLNRITLSLILSLFFAGLAQSQTQTQEMQLQQLSERLSKEVKLQRADVIAVANREGIPIRTELEDGTIFELIRFYNGMPMYYSTANADGAALLETNELHTGGSSGLHLSGSNQVIGLWDAGIPRLDHQEYAGRVSVHNNWSSNVINHASRVTGTLIASGSNLDAKGMAPGGMVKSYNWIGDLSTMASAAADASNALRNSVHPYQINVGWSFGNFNLDKGLGWYWYGDQNDDESFFFGYYDETARNWDELAYLAPEYSIVVSAGNQRGEIYPDGTSEDMLFIFYDLNGDGVSNWEAVTDIRTVEPGFEIPGADGGIDGYNSISSFNLAKNIITVGSVDSDKNMSSNSSWGPTDDGRIKPDIVAKGESVFSSSGGNIDSYNTASGTSFSAPMISGSIALLLELQENLNPGQYLHSSTIRSLIIHTAEDLGNPGPNYEFGWGLMNAKDAAKVMTDNAEHGIHIHELTIQEGEEIFINVRAKGGEPLRATIAWTDPPINESGIVEYGKLNDDTSMLVNDLDLRILNGSTVYSPFILDPENPSNTASTGDNFRDNVEMVHIDSPSTGEIYTLRITHKDELKSFDTASGTLTPGPQNFSLIVTGNEVDVFTLEIEESDGEGWRFLSSPTSATYLELLEPVWTQGPLNSNFPSSQVSPNVLLFDGTSYSSPLDLNTTMPHGSGVAVFLYNDDNLDSIPNWPKSLALSGLEGISPFHIGTSNGLNPGDGIYSILGNPFNSAISFDGFISSDIGGVVYVYDHACTIQEQLDEDGGDSGGCFRAWNGIGAGSLEGGRIAPFQGFFVFSTGSNPSITIPETAKTDIETDFYKGRENYPLIQLVASLNDRLSAETWFSFSDEGSLERNQFDAPYLYPLDYRPFLSLYSEAGKIPYSIKNLPTEFDEEIQIPIHIEGWQIDNNSSENMYMQKHGFAKIKWPTIKHAPSNWTLSLRDNLNGRMINMQRETSYRFEIAHSAKKSLGHNFNDNTLLASSNLVDNEGRFTLIIYPYVTEEPFDTIKPDQIALAQNYPNPFNPSTIIRYELPSESSVTLEVYSIEGQRVATLVNSQQPAGMHSVNFDASNLASGVYLYRLTAGTNVLSRKMILIK